MTEHRPLPYPWSDIRAQLQANFAGVLAALGLKHDLPGRDDGRRIFPLNPMRNDRKPGSFVIWIDGERVGAWKDFATGEQGDVFDLVAGVRRLRSKIDTYWWAVDHLGLDRKGNAAQPRQVGDIEAERRRRERDRVAAEMKAHEEDEAKSAGLFKLWLSLPPIAGTPAEHYLRVARGIDLSRLAHAPEALRWAARAEYVNSQTGEVTEWRNCMVSAMTRGSKLAALHRTYLRADGGGKADVPKPKMMIGPCRGAAIRLSKGPSGLSPAKAAAAGKRGPLAIGEGIETCLTVAAARPDYRVWAAGSLSLMGLLDWPECASAVVLLGENDWKTDARAAFERIHKHWLDQAKGRPVVVVNAARGSDFNDMVRAG
ncbi:MAG TPA: toprim domain-containing protein [Caulobacteraceae bacterium]|nr:toprim domain-containing protein [Caulobacteraceae bacterium]